MRTSLVTEALSMALRRRQPAGGVIFHSDRGTQYQCRVVRPVAVRGPTDLRTMDDSKGAGKVRLFLPPPRPGLPSFRWPVLNLGRHPRFPDSPVIAPAGIHRRVEWSIATWNCP
jgi:hypothetical protein